MGEESTQPRLFVLPDPVVEEAEPPALAPAAPLPVPLDPRGLVRAALAAPLVDTGLPALDRAEAVRRGAVTVVAGAAGSPRGTLVEQIAFAAAGAGRRVAWFSLEDPPLAVARRVVYRLARVQRSESAPTPSVVDAAWAALEGLPLHTWLRCSVDAREVAAAAQQVAAELVVVDGLSALRPLTDDADGVRAMAGFRALAADTGAAVLLVAGIARTARDGAPAGPGDVAPLAAAACDRLVLIDVPALRGPQVPPAEGSPVMAYVDGAAVALRWDVVGDVLGEG